MGLDIQKRGCSFGFPSSHNLQIACWGGMMLSWKFIYNVLLSLKFLISFYETNSHRTQTVFALALICAAGFYCDTDDFITSVLQYYLSTKLTAEICSCNRCQC